MHLREFASSVNRGQIRHRSEHAHILEVPLDGEEGLVGRYCRTVADHQRCTDLVENITVFKILCF